MNVGVRHFGCSQQTCSHLRSTGVFVWGTGGEWWWRTGEGLNLSPQYNQVVVVVVVVVARHAAEVGVENPGAPLQIFDLDVQRSDY